MSRDDVLGPIEAAVAAAPDNLALRVHLAHLLVDAGRSADALAHCDFVLARVPDHAEALEIAARARSGNPREPAVVPLHVIRGGGGAEMPESVDVERPRVTLADVGGMDEVKRRLRTAFLEPLRNPALARAYGKSLRGGLLLYGPPGCGKTFIARATAGELGARFLSVGLTEVLDMYLGQSERNLHELFETARRAAPCVLFLDEVDAIGQKRSHLRVSGLRGVVTALLAELDGMGADNQGVFVLAATNHPWDVDSALRRPGRLDRMLFVAPPDDEARRVILDLHLRGRPLGRLALDRIARATRHYSGADLAHLCESAVELALEEAIAQGEEVPVEQRHLERALAEIKPTTRPWLETARNYALYANDGGQYDDLLAYLRALRV